MEYREDLKRLLREIGTRKASLTDPSQMKRMRARDEVQAVIDKISRRYGQIEAEEAVRLFELEGVLERMNRRFSREPIRLKSHCSPRAAHKISGVVHLWPGGPPPTMDTVT